MKQKTVFAEEEMFYSNKDLADAKRLVKEIEEAMKDSEYRQAAKEFVKYHTGRNLHFS